jgi:hypothetical protein
MAVRLQTAYGKIGTYETIQGICGVEYGPDKYITKCGREWKVKPKPLEECDHLDCAVYIAIKQWNGTPKGFILSIASAACIILFKGGDDLGSALVISGFMTLLAFGILISGIRARTRLEELTEYRDKGTINGITAWQIYEDQEVAKG